MAIDAPTMLITAGEFLQMDFDVPVELVRGEIAYPYGDDGTKRPGTRHGVICTKIGRKLEEWAEPTGCGIAVSNDSSILWEQHPDTVRGPDGYFASYRRLPSRRIPDGFLEVPPELSVEVLSPRDRWKDVWVKVGEHFAAGVNEVWIVHPQSRTVRIIPAEGEAITLSSNDQLVRAELPGFECAVATLFEGA